ncbi:hypothetical protein ACIBAC_41915 [Streptomyces sp. NPDC051362]|uniref:hypothetical protein n=1 Tax=Streptomyces sp. NPDC051362 TaxID=3365651 RepID=UPI0037B78D43
MTDVYVPAGLATHAAGTGLRASEATFFRAAVTAMALGAARRITEALADLTPSRPAALPTELSPAASAAELAAVLHDARTALAAELHNMPGTDKAAGSLPEEPADSRLMRVGPTVRQVVAAAYEQALPAAGHYDGHPLEDLVEAATPTLQCMRFAMELMHLPTSHAKGPTR